MFISEPSVSVVIPVRDGERTIERAIRSALEQSSPPTEVIVVDDNSRDKTKQRVLELGRDRAVVVDGEGRGVAAARNAGIRSATSTWIAFLDGDDYWGTDFLKLARTRIASAPDAVACFGAATHVNDTGQVIGRHDMQGTITLEELVAGRIATTASATLARRDVVIECGGFCEDIRLAAEDLDLWWRLAARGPCVGFPQAAAVYVVHDARDRARSQDVLSQMERDRELVIERLAATGATRSLVRRGRAVMRARTARYWLRAGRAADARATARSSLRALPTLEGLGTLALASLPRALRDPILLLRRRQRAAGLLGRM